MAGVWVREDLTGQVDGVETTFTASTTFSLALVRINGNMRSEGVTFASPDITLPFAPKLGDELVIFRFG